MTLSKLQEDEKRVQKTIKNDTMIVRVLSWNPQEKKIGAKNV